MEKENQEIIYCEDDNDYRIYCDICDKFRIRIERFFNNHLYQKLIRIIFKGDNN